MTRKEQNDDNKTYRTTMAELNKYSKTLTQDVTQPAAQAMYYAIGFKEADFCKSTGGHRQHGLGW